MVGPGHDLRVQYHGLAAPVRGRAPDDQARCCRLGLLKRRVWLCAGIGHPGQGRAASLAPASVWHQQGLSDLLAREYFLDYKIPAINVRLFNTTGPGKTNDAPSDFVLQLVRIKKGQQRPVIEVGNLKPRRAFLDCADTVRGFYLAATKGKRGEAYNLCAARTNEVGELLRKAIRLSGVTPEIRPVPRLMRPSDEKIIFGSTRKMRKDTGWRPLNSLEQTLGSCWNIGTGSCDDSAAMACRSGRYSRSSACWRAGISSQSWCCPMPRTARAHWKRAFPSASCARQLRSQGIRRVVMCTRHLADQIETEFGDGHKWDVAIVYSKESSPSRQQEQ